MMNAEASQKGEKIRESEIFKEMLFRKERRKRRREKEREARPNLTPNQPPPKQPPEKIKKSTSKKAPSTMGRMMYCCSRIRMKS